MVSLTTKRFSAGQAGWQRLAFTPALGDAMSPCGPQGRFQCFSCRVAVRCTTGSPRRASGVIRTPGCLFTENMRRPPTNLFIRPAPGPSPTSTLPKELATANHVFVRRGAPGAPLSPLYDCPCQVLECGPKFFKLKVGGRLDNVSVDRSKPCLTREVVPAVPPRRGRPPGSSTSS